MGRAHIPIVTSLCSLLNIKINVQPETAADTKEADQRSSRTSVQKNERRSRKEDKGSKGRVD